MSIDVGGESECAKRRPLRNILDKGIALVRLRAIVRGVAEIPKGPSQCGIFREPSRIANILVSEA
jgi:hypothetical protein